MRHSLGIPDEICQRAEVIARRTSQTVDQLLPDYIRSLTVFPSDEQAELKALRSLSDDTLWTIAVEQMPAATQARMQT